MPTPHPPYLDGLGPKLRDGQQLLASGAVDLKARAPKVSTAPAMEVRKHLQAAYVTDMKGDLVSIGSQAADDCVNLRDLSRLRRFAEDANSTDERTARIGMNALLGAATRFADIISAGNANGTFRVSGSQITRSDVLYAFTLGRGKFVPLFHAITRTMVKLVEKSPNLRVGNAAARAEQAEPVAQKVEIVGLPERITTSTVRYDSNGDISGTTMVETDS